MAEAVLEIVETATGEVVETFDVSEYAPRQIEKFIDGLSINFNFDSYHMRPDLEELQAAVEEDRDG